MMEETVPNASANTSGTAARRQRATATASSATSASSPQRNRNTSAAFSTDDDSDRSRRRRFNASLFLSPTFIISKVILILTIFAKILLFPFRKVANLIFPSGEFDDLLQPSVSKKAAEAFIQTFTKDHIQPMQARATALDDNDNADASLLECPFLNAGYTTTVNDLANQGQHHNSAPDNNPPPPLLLIYIHSPLHGKVPAFLQNTLCNQRVLSLINQHRNSGTLTCWGGSIHTADGANAKDTLQVSSFPFLSLVRIQPTSSSSSSPSTSSSSRNNRDEPLPAVERKLEVLFRMEGPALQKIRPATLHTHLSNALVAYQGILSEQAMRRLQRQEEVHLREEQDREYRQTLEEDQRRQREKLEEQERKEEEEKKSKEEEEQAMNEKMNRLDNARDVLNRNGEGEPDPGDKSIATARVRLMLPSGKRVERRFRGNDTIDTMRAFLVLHFDGNGVDIENFQLNSNYPKKALVDGERTLENEGLCPQAVIMVQDLDA